MRLLTIDRTPTGWRVHVRRWRVHHGRLGAVLALVGAVLMAHDRRDWPWPLVDR